MKIDQILSSLENEAAGTSYSVPRLARALNAEGYPARLIVLESDGYRVEAGVPVVRYARDLVFPPVLKRLGRSSAMRGALLSSDADVFHAHGLWMMPNVYPAEAARRLGRPFILSPRGMLGKDALKFSATVKELFWALWQSQAVQTVTCFHATAESELDDIRDFGLRQPVAIIPNGVDLPSLAKLDDLEGQRLSSSEPPYLLSLGRIHPKKGLDRLIQAFSLVAAEFPEWRLRIIGRDEVNHVAQLKQQIAALNFGDRITIEPPAFGDTKFRLMRHAEVFVLSTLHENFGITVAESLAVETPVISTRGAPWEGLNKQGCGWWIEHGPEPLAAALRAAMTLDRQSRRSMGKQGREWMERDFGWQSVAQKMTEVYRWTLSGGPRPDCVDK